VHHDRRDHPVVGVSDFLCTLGRPVVEPGCGVHLRATAVKQRVVDRDGHCRVTRYQRRTTMRARIAETASGDHREWEKNRWAR